MNKTEQTKANSKTTSVKKQPIIKTNADGTKTYDFSQGGVVDKVVTKQGEVVTFKF